MNSYRPLLVLLFGLLQAACQEDKDGLNESDPWNQGRDVNKYRFQAPTLQLPDFKPMPGVDFGQNFHGQMRDVSLAPVERSLPESFKNLVSAAFVGVGVSLKYSCSEEQIHKMKERMSPLDRASLVNLALLNIDSALGRELVEKIESTSDRSAPSEKQDLFLSQIGKSVQKPEFDKEFVPGPRTVRLATNWELGFGVAGCFMSRNFEITDLLIMDDSTLVYSLEKREHSFRFIDVTGRSIKSEVACPLLVPERQDVTALDEALQNTKLVVRFVEDPETKSVSANLSGQLIDKFFCADAIDVIPTQP